MMYGTSSMVNAPDRGKPGFGAAAGFAGKVSPAGSTPSHMVGVGRQFGACRMLLAGAGRAYARRCQRPDAPGLCPDIAPARALAAAGWSPNGAP